MQNKDNEYAMKNKDISVKRKGKQTPIQYIPKGKKRYTS